CSSDLTEYKKSHGEVILTEADVIHQITSVLKMKTGEQCIIVGENNEDILCIIKDIRKDEIKCAIEEVIENTNDSVKDVTLYMAILKKENFELVVQKASEIGITKIVPMITTRTVKTGLNFDRINKIAREASELSGRSTVTEITEITTFPDALQNDTNSNKILFDITGKQVESQKLKVESLSIYIGPEGGFTDQEIDEAKEHNLNIYNLGKLTLRGETAGIIACYLALQ
ncbi:MAG: rRNA (uracil1498-N3)-methyltransferase, partial [Bacteroidota bacterium]|nr:rRNA (uracil1498-N3)-methyltransferase [Bacteroidota bacterium]